MLYRAKESDFKDLLELNQAHLPAVSSIDLDWLYRAQNDWKMDLFLQRDPDQRLLGLLFLCPPGQAYESQNYRFFSERYESFLYLDRVIVCRSEQGKGWGQKYYAYVEEMYREQYAHIACEVNTRPRNEASLAFHNKQGFYEVGIQSSEDDSKEVSMLLKDL